MQPPTHLSRSSSAARSACITVTRGRSSAAHSSRVGASNSLTLSREGARTREPQQRGPICWQPGRARALMRRATAARPLARSAGAPLKCSSRAAATPARHAAWGQWQVSGGEAASCTVVGGRGYAARFEGDAAATLPRRRRDGEHRRKRQLELEQHDWGQRGGGWRGRELRGQTVCRLGALDASAGRALRLGLGQQRQQRAHLLRVAVSGQGSQRSQEGRRG